NNSLTEQMRILCSSGSNGTVQLGSSTTLKLPSITSATALATDGSGNVQAASVSTTSSNNALVQYSSTGKISTTGLILPSIISAAALATDGSGNVTAATTSTAGAANAIVVTNNSGVVNGSGGFNASGGVFTNK